eukprot:10606490-Alexandrium_andersonii.AAC.1
MARVSSNCINSTGVQTTVPPACQYCSLPATASSFRVHSGGIAYSPASRSPNVGWERGPTVSVGSSRM